MRRPADAPESEPISLLRVILLGALLVSTSAWAEHLPIQVWTSGEGLPRDRVLAVLEDSRGLMWIGGDGWLARFDGGGFRTYGAGDGLPAGEVRQIVETAGGALWIATASGPCRFHGERANPLPIACQRLGGGTGTEPIGVFALLEDGGRLWAASSDGLWSADPSADPAVFERVALAIPRAANGHASLRALSPDGSGGLWLATGRGIARRTSRGKVFAYATFTGAGDDRVASVLRDRAGRLWVAHFDRGLLVWWPPDEAHMPEPGWSLEQGDRAPAAPGALGLPSRPGEVCRLTTAAGLPDDRVRNGLMQSSDGAVWAGTVSGLVRLRGEELRTYGRSEGFGDDALSPAAEDRDGDLWFGSASGGVMRWSVHGLTSYGAEDGLIGGRMREFVEDGTDGLTVLGEGSFAQRFDGRRFEPSRFGPAPPLVEGWGWGEIGFEDERGGWWIADSGGIAVYPSARSAPQRDRRPAERVYGPADGLPGADVFRLYRDRAGRTWASLIDTGGLAVMRPAARRFERVEARAPATGESPLALAFAENRAGDVWIGFDDGRLRHWHQDRLELQGMVHEPSAIVALRFDSQDRLWLATQAGEVIALRDAAASAPQIERFHLAKSGPQPEILSLEVDAFDRPYFGSWSGVDRLDPRTRAVRHIGRRDGLANSVVQTIHRDATGALWFGTFQGVSRLMPEPPGTPARAPSLRVMGLDVAGHRQSLPEFGVQQLEGLVLEADQNNLRVRLAGLSSAEACDFSTRLADAEALFSEFRPDATVAYASLRPGAYRLEARARCGSAETPVATVLTFRVLAPWWSRGWFLALSAAIVAGLVFAAHRQRLQRALAVERVRTQIATDLHDDLGQNLSRIAILSEVAKRAPNSDVKRLDEIADTARALADAAGEIVWAIDPRRDDLETLLARLQRSSEELLTERGVGWRFELGPGASAISLPPEARRHLYLVLKEAIHNAARHSGAGLVELSLRRNGRDLVAEVRDDGRGFVEPPAGEPSSRSGSGLLNMRQRAEQLGAALEIRPRETGGTVVRLRLRAR